MHKKRSLFALLSALVALVLVGGAALARVDVPLPDRAALSSSIDLARVPAHVRAAFLLAEDRRFYEHAGTDVRAVAVAAVENARAGEAKRGGSTITEQTAKLLLPPGERSVARRARTAVLASKLEDALTKDEIFALYLSRVPFAGGVVGLEGGARAAFDKRVEELSLVEGVALATAVKDPTVARDEPAKLLPRREALLDDLVASGACTAAEAAVARAALAEDAG